MGRMHGQEHQGVNAIDVISMINIGLKNIWCHRKVPIQ